MLYEVITGLADGGELCGIANKKKLGEMIVRATRPTCPCIAHDILEQPPGTELYEIAIILLVADP